MAWRQGETDYCKRLAHGELSGSAARHCAQGEGLQSLLTSRAQTPHVQYTPRRDRVERTEAGRGQPKEALLIIRERDLEGTRERKKGEPKWLARIDR